jgi:hypothetical protein
MKTVFKKSSQSRAIHSLATSANKKNACVCLMTDKEGGR